MKKYILKKRIFAILFWCVILSFSAINFVHSYEPLKEIVLAKEKPAVMVEKLETAIDENLYGRMNLIETYGLIQAVFDKRESNNFSYIVDEQGFLHYASFFREEDPHIFDYALRVKRLKDYVEKKGTKVLFAVPPGKYNKEFTQLRTGLSVNNPDSVVDELLFYLNRFGVTTLDLRKSFPNEELSYEEVFFKTDHHWTIPAAFYAMGEVVDCIETEFGTNLDPEDYYCDIDNYDVVMYRNGMLGSMGRKTGATYSGMEDFIAIWPRYEGNFSRVSMSDEDREYDSEGDFVESLLKVSVLNENTDPYSDSQYSLYMDGIRSFDKVINYDNPEGPRILMIRDSYFSPVMAFMTPMCSELHSLWTLEENEELDIESYVKEETFDYIIVEVYPYNMEDRAFNYFKGE